MEKAHIHPFYDGDKCYSLCFFQERQPFLAAGISTSRNRSSSEEASEVSVDGVGARRDRIK